MKPHDRTLAALALLLGLPLLFSATAHAQAARDVPQAASTTVIPSSSLQHALAIRVAGGAVEARACASGAGCQPSGGTIFKIPAEADASKAKIDTIELESGRAVAQVRVPLKKAPGVWTVLLATTSPPDAPAVDTKVMPVVLERLEGLEGERKSVMIVREAGQRGERVLLGSRYENAEVCGRASLMSVRELDPDDLLWNPSATRALSDAEKRAAPSVFAMRATGFSVDKPQLMHGVLASSARGKSRASLTDKDVATAWTEQKPGDGAGEFLVMTASDDVPVSGFELVIKPSTPLEQGAAPKSFYLVSRNEVFKVGIEEDAWAADGGIAFQVVLPKPVSSDCFAVVLNTAYAKEGTDRVTIAELRATTRFDGHTIPDLVAALDRPNDADAARALLVRSGEPGATATIAGYDRLTPDGQQRALEVIEGGACETIAPFFVDRLLGKGAAPDFDPNLDRTARMARERLRLCKTAAGEALTAAVKQGPPDDRRVWAAEELATLAPAAAVEVLLSVLEEGSTAPKESGARDAIRRGLRAALTAATQHKRARHAVEEKLAEPAFAKLSLVQRIDLLRAVGVALPTFPQSSKALTSLLGADATFRTRFLLLEPAAHLARGGDKPATDYLQKSLRDRDKPHLRARAARVGVGIAAIHTDMRGALADDSPRVREAALAATSEDAKLVAQVEPKIIELLERDPWTFVRIGAAEGMARTKASARGDGALVHVIEDREGPPRLRASALRALGKRRASGSAAAVRRIADNPKESVPIRVAAIAALGDMCDAEATELLYKLAIRAGYQQIPYDQPLGMAALAALGHLKPSDLHQKLAPLFVKNKIVPPQVRLIARSVLEQPGTCR